MRTILSLALVLLPLSAAVALEGKKPPKKMIALATADTKYARIGCPAAWTLEISSPDSLSAHCFLGSIWFLKDKPERWADITYAFVNTSDRPGRSFAAVLRDKDCATNTYPQLAGGFCGRRIGPITVAGKEGVLLQTGPNREQTHKTLEILAEAAGRVYLIELAAPVDQFESYMPLFGAALARFEPIPPKTH